MNCHKLSLDSRKEFRPSPSSGI